MRMPTKFKVGDAVVLKQSRHENVPDGVCVLTKVLPDRNGEREIVWRVLTKSTNAWHVKASCGVSNPS
jgi:hypothetical protein